MPSCKTNVQIPKKSELRIFRNSYFYGIPKIVQYGTVRFQKFRFRNVFRNSANPQPRSVTCLVSAYRCPSLGLDTCSVTQPTIPHTYSSTTMETSHHFSNELWRLHSAAPWQYRPLSITQVLSRVMERHIVKSVHLSLIC